MSRERPIEVPVELEGLSLSRELSSGRWVLEGWGRRVVAREWRWGERRRLLEACRSDEGLDAERFVAALVELLCEPAPPGELRWLYAHVLLELFGVDGEAPLPRLDDSELALTRSFGWLPSALDGESAVDLDRLLRSAQGFSTPARAQLVDEGPPPGWKRIVITDDQP